MNLSHPWRAALIVAAGVAARLLAIDAPPFDYHAIRQYDTAAIARNFAEEEMNPLHPRIDWRGDSTGYVESEFPAYTFLVALLYRAFGAHEWLGRLLNVLLFALSATLLHRWAVRLLGDRPALLAIFFYTAMPLAVFFNRTVQTDTLLCFASLVSVYAFEGWTKSGRPRHLAASAAGTALALLIKPFTAYLALPLGYLAYRRFGPRLLRQPALWLYGAAATVPALLWYRHAYRLWEEHGNTLFRGYARLSIPGLFDPFWPEYAGMIVERIVFLVATPAGLAFLVVGALAAPMPGSRVLHLWVLGVALSMFVANEPHYDHEYYQLPLAFAAALFMAHGATLLVDRGLFSRRAVIASGALFVVLGAWRLRPFYAIPAESYQYVDYGRRVEQLVPPGEPVIVLQVGPDPRRGEWYQHRIAPGEYVLYYPMDLYLSRRKGWSLGNDARLSPALLERLRRRGARALVTFYPYLLDETPGLRDWLQAHIQLEETARYAIYRLRAVDAADGAGRTD